MKLKRKFYGVVTSTGEVVEIHDYRDEINTTTNFNVATRSSAPADKPHCWTTNGRHVRVKDDLFKYFDYENLQGKWEIYNHGNWVPLTVSDCPPNH